MDRIQAGRIAPKRTGLAFIPTAFTLAMTYSLHLGGKTLTSTRNSVNSIYAN